METPFQEIPPNSDESQPQPNETPCGAVPPQMMTWKELFNPDTPVSEVPLDRIPWKDIFDSLAMDGSFREIELFMRWLTPPFDLTLNGVQLSSDEIGERFGIPNDRRTFSYDDLVRAFEKEVELFKLARPDNDQKLFIKDDVAHLLAAIEQPSLTLNHPELFIANGHLASSVEDEGGCKSPLFVRISELMVRAAKEKKLPPPIEVRKWLPEILRQDMEETRVRLRKLFGVKLIDYVTDPHVSISESLRRHTKFAMLAACMGDM